MKKKLIATLLTASMAFSAAPIAMADDGDVEVSFKVGDSILLINGNPTEVETPYIAGEGTTLVPLRVITEAFGAQVGWDGATKTITLTYPDVNIVLQIDNIVAQVNDHSETLLEAPALSANGVTMVPLRFISETFGADVGYDSETSAVLVTKKAIDSSTVVGVTDMKRIGDDYYGWSIDNPLQMNMTDRRLDGLSTKFEADDGSRLYVDIYTNTADTIKDFEKEYADIKDSFSGYTLTEAEKLTDEAGNRYMHFQAKDKESIIDYREYYGAGYTTFEVTSIINISDDTTTKNMILSIADSFKLGSYDAKETYNLSNVENNKRTIKDEKYKFSFQIPADYYQSTSSEAENEFLFISSDTDSNAYVALDIYSKSADVTASKLAYNDQAVRIKNTNPKYSKISEVSEQNGIYSYTHSISGSSKFDQYAIDTFFEKGDYVYNMTAVVDTLEDAPTASLILGSLVTEELDSAVIGKLLRNDADSETAITHEVGSCKFSLPASWTETAEMTNTAGTKATTFADSQTTSMFAIAVIDDDSVTTGSLTSRASSYKNFIKDDKSNEIIDDVDYISLNSQRFARFSYKATDKNSGTVGYHTVYLKTFNDTIILAELIENEIYYNANGQEVIEAALSSLTVK